MDNFDMEESSLFFLYDDKEESPEMYGLGFLENDEPVMVSADDNLLISNPYDAEHYEAASEAVDMDEYLNDGPEEDEDGEKYKKSVINEEEYYSNNKSNQEEVEEDFIEKEEVEDNNKSNQEVEDNIINGGLLDVEPRSEKIWTMALLSEWMDGDQGEEEKNKSSQELEDNVSLFSECLNKVENQEEEYNNNNQKLRDNNINQELEDNNINGGSLVVYGDLDVANYDPPSEIVLRSQQQQQEEDPLRVLLPVATTTATAPMQQLPPMPDAASNKKTGRWTETEHISFLIGLKTYGHNWIQISNHYVTTRTPEQIASHNQKFDERQKKKKRSNPDDDTAATAAATTTTTRKKRRSIHDITIYDLLPAPQYMH